MSNFIKNRLRLRRRPQSQGQKLWVIQLFSLKFLFLQLLIVTPTQNIPPRFRSAAHEKNYSMSMANKGVENTEQTTTTNGDSTLMPLENLGFKNSKSKYSSTKTELSNYTAKFDGEFRKLLTMKNEISQGNQARLNERNRYLEDNRTVLQSNISLTRIFNGSFTNDLAVEIENSLLATNTTTDNATQKLKQPVILVKEASAGQFSLTNTLNEDLSGRKTRNVSNNYLIVPKSLSDSSVKPRLVSINASMNTSSSSGVGSGDSDGPYFTDTNTAILLPTTNFTSCVERCGDDTSFPCSCDKKCLVFKNCCEDIQDACPQLYSQAENMFQHLVSAQIRCDPTTVVFMVESCPTNSPLRKPSTNTNERMVELLSNAPVTDYASGIIYANSSIFSCNEHAHRVLDSSAVYWKVQSGTKDSHFVSSVSSVSKKLDLSLYSYVPPPTQPDSAGSLCYTDSTTSCISELSAGLGIGPVTCDLSVQDYYTILKTVRLELDSVSTALEICEVCLSTEQSDSIGDFRFPSTGLRVLMSLSEDPVRVMYSVVEETKIRGRSLPWLSWTCDIPGGVVDQSADVPCEVVECNAQFVYTPEGTCRTNMDVEVALQDDFMLNGNKCKIDPDVLANVAYCYLREFANLGAMDSPYVFSKVFQDNLNLNVTVIRMEMYKMNISQAFSETFLANSLSQAMLLFVNQYCSQSQKGASWKNQSFSSTNQKASDSYNIKWSLNHILGVNIIEDTNITDIPSSIFFTYCFRDSKPGQFLIHVTFCHKYGEFALGRVNTVKIDEFVSTTANTRCPMSVFSTYNSGGIRVSFMFSYFIVFAVGLNWQ